MRRVKLSVASSLDGYLTGPDGAIDWIRMGSDFGMNAFMASVDTTLVGRGTFEFVRASGMKLFLNMTNYVFSQSLPAGRSDEVEIVGEDAARFVRRLKAEEGKDLWLYGGGALIGSMLRARLVDDIVVTVHPVLVGGGVPLFGMLEERQDLELVEAKALTNGVVLVKYRVGES